MNSLREFMRERLNGFASGRLYTFEGIVPPDRVQFLWFEFSLLLCLLSTDLQSSLDAEGYWKRIAPPVLKEFSPDISSARLDEIMTAARGYMDVWIRHENDAPLSKILDFPMLAAFGCTYDSKEYPDILRLSAAKILDDTFEFVNRYTSIVRPA
ncbi:MAG TPA: hypothetical protein VIY49_13540 [Bryobacteraceae bacterium]